eukprot:TRINITY_DN2482_c0_g2_i2.p1 TRINITY_DN2482_c0_g2~~TRINITY_DN2482_c0_g2_i2.p1  ORF type:complete len:507 (-),score=76.48 TRINITY_DN2482_c0_g2_i2:1039-2559(-)
MSFSSAYHTLVHAGHWESETIISLEHSMHMEMNDRWLIREQEMKLLQTRQESEMKQELQRATNSECDVNEIISRIVTRHLEEVEKLESQIKAKNLRLARKHRKDFREHIFKMYRALVQKQRLGQSDGSDDGLSISDTSSNHGDQAEVSKLGSITSYATSAISLAAATVTAPVGYVGGILNKGFSILSKAPLPGLPYMGAVGTSQDSANLAVSKPARQEADGFSHANQTIAEDYQRRNPPGRHAMIFSTESAEAKTKVDQNIESFSVYLGPMQVKRMFNIQMVSKKDMWQMLSSASQSDKADRSFFAMNLYSDTISAIIIPYNFSTVKAENMRDLLELSSRGSELHFDPIELQMSKVIQAFSENPLSTGDFFATRHSSITGAHIIFHLVVDPRHASNHPYDQVVQQLMEGFQRILHVATKYHISQLSVPINLVDMPSTELKSTSAGVHSVNRSQKMMRLLKSHLHDSCLAFRSEGDTQVSPQTVQLVVLDNMWDKYRQNMLTVFNCT